MFEHVLYRGWACEHTFREMPIVERVTKLLK